MLSVRLKQDVVFTKEKFWDELLKGKFIMGLDASFDSNGVPSFVLQNVFSYVKDIGFYIYDVSEPIVGTKYRLRTASFMECTDDDIKTDNIIKEAIWQGVSRTYNALMVDSCGNIDTKSITVGPAIQRATELLRG